MAALLALLSTLANPTYDDCCLNALLRGDPHCTGAHHDHFSMRGEHNGIYNVLTASNLSFNAQFEFKMFRTPWSKMLVNGSFVRNAFFVVRTPKTGRRLHIAYLGREPHQTVLSGDINTVMRENTPQLMIEGIMISLARRKLTVKTPRWRVTVESTIALPHRGVLRMNLRVTSLYHVCANPIAPHGILGQTFDCDGIGVHGRQDDLYSMRDRGIPVATRRGVGGGVVSTKAQAEGALEGHVGDYRLNTPWATEFRFSRFNSSRPVGPRSLSARPAPMQERARPPRRALTACATCLLEDVPHVLEEDSDGHAWLLVMAYHLDTIGGSCRTCSSTVSAPGTWGAYKPDALPDSREANSHLRLSELGFTVDDVQAVRVYCRTTDHDRVVHVRSEAACAKKLVVDSSSSDCSTSGSDWKDSSAQVTYESDHTGNLPGAATESAPAGWALTSDNTENLPAEQGGGADHMTSVLFWKSYGETFGPKRAFCDTVNPPPAPRSPSMETWYEIWASVLRA